ncbi:hypothetical protein BHE74_00046902 [Ensete ventricosum]|nr:hypothetical protein GW17_00023314 [Ensete ventricosum]RWW47131.1 hypothetical protein BHE74_00046902 [Ensete ventricosum]RZS23184.1 hypothetical protein BHM03_00056064 [Ensete ventricosum]
MYILHSCPYVWISFSIVLMIISCLSFPMMCISFLSCRGEAGKWIALIAVVLRLFFPRHFPEQAEYDVSAAFVVFGFADWLEMPAVFILLVVVAPGFFASTVRNGLAGVFICLAIGCYLLQEHIRASGGFRNSFTKSHGISNSIGIILLLVYPIWRLVVHFL